MNVYGNKEKKKKKKFFKVESNFRGPDPFYFLPKILEMPLLSGRTNIFHFFPHKGIRNQKICKVKNFQLWVA